jgi:hypothetical protein
MDQRATNSTRLKTLRPGGFHKLGDKVLLGRGDAFSLSVRGERGNVVYAFAPRGNRRRFVYKPRRESLSRWTRTNSIFNPLLEPRWRRLASSSPRGLVSVLGNAARIRRLLQSEFAL